MTEAGTIVAGLARGNAQHAPLDWLNFLLADVQGGLGPFLAIYLTASRHWAPGAAGSMLTIAGRASVAARTPMGGLIDRIRWKRGLVAGAAAAVAVAAVTETLLPFPWPVGLAQFGSGVAEAAFPPAIAALSLGLVGARLTARGSAAAKPPATPGNVVTPALSGIAGLRPPASRRSRLIDPRAIDHRVARGGDDGHAREPGTVGGLSTILTCRPLVVFTLSIALFHFANAAMLPLAG